MWVTNGTNIQMTAGDFGVALPISFDGLPALADGDAIRLTVKTGQQILLTRDWDSLTDNTVQLTVTESETAQLPAGRYAYIIDVYHDGEFLYNVLSGGVWVVTPK